MSGSTSDASRRESFIERASLILITAAIGGVLVPTVNWVLSKQRVDQQAIQDDQRLRDQRVFEANVARQSGLIQMQHKFLEEVETLLTAFHTRAAALAWYKTQQKDAKKYALALEAYDQKSWDFIAQIHAAESKSKRLTPSSAHEKFAQHIREWESLDKDLVLLTQQSAVPESKWIDMLHRINRLVTDSLEVLHALASAYEVTPQTVSSP